MTAWADGVCWIWASCAIAKPTTASWSSPIEKPVFSFTVYYFRAFTCVSSIAATESCSADSMRCSTASWRWVWESAACSGTRFHISTTVPITVNVGQSADTTGKANSTCSSRASPQAVSYTGQLTISDNERGSQMISSQDTARLSASITPAPTMSKATTICPSCV